MKDCKHKELIFVSINSAEFMETEAEFEAICKCYECGRTLKLEGLTFTEPRTEDSVTVEFKMVEK